MFEHLVGDLVGEGGFNAVCAHVNDPTKVIMFGELDLFKLDNLILFGMVHDYNITKDSMEIILDRKTPNYKWNSDIDRKYDELYIQIDDIRSQYRSSMKTNKPVYLLDLATNPIIDKLCPKLCLLCQRIIENNLTNDVFDDGGARNWLWDEINQEFIPADIFVASVDLQSTGKSSDSNNTSVVLSSGSFTAVA